MNRLVVFFALLVLRLLYLVIAVCGLPFTWSLMMLQRAISAIK